MGFRKGALLVFTFFILFTAGAQQVPTFMNFADQKLKITDAAKREIQKDVDMLTRSPRHFKIKVDRANEYFGIIERVFKEEGIPDDFKYLVLQESALIPDAVSSSNAVGFWQMKKTAATEMGLRIDHMVDERMNIVASSRAAANYLKKYNNLFFHNWLYMLQSYNVGPGGGLRSLNKNKFGAKNMVVDKQTHWYVKKYLAHKIAFEGAIDSKNSPHKLAEISNGSVESLKDISRKYNVDTEVVKDYNKWVKGNKIPNDKLYIAVVPVSGDSPRALLAMVDNSNGASANAYNKGSKSSDNRHSQHARSITYEMGSAFPIIDKKIIRKSSLSYTKVNGIPGVIAKDGQTISSLSARGGISIEKFRSYNDLKSSESIQAGQPYYFKKKKSKAKTHYYAAKPNETMWSIAQKFGVRMDKLMMKNRMVATNELKPGRILWLRFIRPAEEPIEYIPIPDDKPTVPNDRILLADKQPSIPNKNDLSSDTFEKSNTSFQEKTIVNESKEEKSIQQTPVKSSTTMESNSLSKPNNPVVNGWEKNEPVNMLGENTNSDIEPFEAEETPTFVGISRPDAREVDGKKVHKIKAGETLFSIARSYDVTVDQLSEWNDLENGNIKFDQELIVGKSVQEAELIVNNPLKTGPDSIIIHEVTAGETIYSIARIYNIPIEKIMELNNKTAYDLSIGDKLKVFKGK